MWLTQPDAPATALLVVMRDEATARWASEPVDVGAGQMQFKAHVLGPSRVPLVRSNAEAQNRPYLAVLSALAHGHGAGGVAAAEAAILATQTLDDMVRFACHDSILDALDEAARRELEAKLGLENDQVKSIIGKSLMAQGRAEGEARGEARGRAAGEARGRAAAIVAVLQARGVVVSDEQAQRVTSCTDLAMLERWLTRAATASSAAAVFGDG